MFSPFLFCLFTALTIPLELLGGPLGRHIGLADTPLELDDHSSPHMEWFDANLAPLDDHSRIDGISHILDPLLFCHWKQGVGLVM